MRSHQRALARALRRNKRYASTFRSAQSENKVQKAKFDHNTTVVKLTIIVGLTALFFLPPQHKEWAGYAINLLWLIKT